MPSSGYFPLLYSINKKPLENWSKRHSQTGRVWKTLDSDLLEDVVELQDLQKSNNLNTSIICPAQSFQFLDIELPLLVIIVKNMNVECHFIVQVIDAEQNRHHFHFSNETLDPNARVTTSVISRVHVKLETGWNRVEIDLDDLTQRAFNSRYRATQRLAIYANCRLRRIYFIDRHYDDFEISAELCHAVFDRYLIKHEYYLTRKTFHEKNCTISKTNYLQFLRDLQTKSATVITEFFSGINNKTKQDNVFDFQTKMKLMFLAIPKIRDYRSLDMVYNQKSKWGSIRCMTPTRNEIFLQSVAHSKQRITEQGTIVKDPLEGKPMKESVPTTKPRRKTFKNVRKPRKYDKPRSKSCQRPFIGQRGYWIDPQIIAIKSASKNKNGESSKDAVNILSEPVIEDQRDGDLPKSKIKKKKKRGTPQCCVCNWHEQNVQKQPNFSPSECIV